MNGLNSYTKVNYLRGWSITSKGQEYETKSSDFSNERHTYEVYSDAKVKRPSTWLEQKWVRWLV